MNDKLNSTLSLLKRKIDGQRPKEASNYIQNLSGCFDEALTNSEIELAIDTIFNVDRGTIALLSQTIQYDKLFKQCNIEIFQLHLKIIREYPGKMTRYVSSVIQYTTKYLIAVNVSAREKEFCMQIIQELFLKKLCDSIDFPTVLEKLFRIFNESDPAARLHQLTFEVVGLICRDFAHHMLGVYQERFHKAIFKTLDRLLVKKDKISLGTVAGAIDGLNCFLINFPPSGEDATKECDYIYKCVKELSEVGDIREKALFRSAMLLLTSHTKLLAEQLIRDYKYWHEALQKWLQFTYEDRRIAINAINAVHKQHAATLIERSRPEDVEVLQFYFKYFMSVLRMSNAQPHEIRIAIQGFGLMAGPCKAIVSAEQMEDLLNLVIQATDHSYFTEKINKREHMEHMADFMESLSQIMAHMPVISRYQIDSLERMMIKFIEDFHFLSSAHHELTIKALLNTCVNLSQLEGTIFNDVLEKVTKQGVIWTCSHKLIYDAFRDENEQDWKENITYRNYLPLWKGIFSAGKRLHYTKVSESFYENFIAATIGIIKKLNLQTKKRTYKDENGKDEEFTFCDPNIDLTPVVPNDFNIFFNLIDLFRDVVGAQTVDHHRENFQPWIQEFCSLILINMQKYPLVSGFSKLLELVLSVAEKIKFFEKDHMRERFGVHSIVTYLMELLIHRAQFTSGELQIACFQAILNIPMEIAETLLKDLKEILKMAFDIGKSILWLANRALTVLFKIIKRNQGSDVVKEILESVLPCLDVFLQSKGFSNPSTLSVEIVRHQNRRKIQKNFRHVDTDSELLKFQKRIYDFIGFIEPELCLYLLNNKKHMATNLTKWDTDSSIKLKIHCTDVSPIVCLDPLLPRIFQLALSSSDRKVKISACELLHGIVLYMIGIPVRSSIIWKEMWRQLVYLGCDADVAVQQMFEPLLMQIMHYKAKPNQDGINELLDAIMENLSHPANAAVRDLAARCLREFVSWTLKQSPQDHQNPFPTNLIKIVTQLEFYCWNFDVYHRLGASLAFNNLYRILREDENFLKRYWIKIAYLFCTNLRLCMKSSRTQNEDMAVDQASIALDHIVRVLCERSDLFVTANEERIKPKVLKEATLKHLALWIFHECGSHSKVYRDKCTEIFMKIATQVKEYASVKKFLSDCVTNDEILAICEGNVDNVGIAMHPDLKHIGPKETFPMQRIYDFILSLITDLDNQIWLLGGDLITQPSEIVKKSKIFHAIDYYLENICWKTDFEILQLLKIEVFSEGHNVADSLLSGEVMLQIASAKAQLSVKLMDFLTKVLQFCSQDFPRSFWRTESKIVKFIVDVIFQPQELGLDFRHTGLEEGLPMRTEMCLMRLKRDTPREFSQQITIEIEKELTEGLKRVTDKVEEVVLGNSVSTADIRTAKGIQIVCKYVTLSASAQRFFNASIKVLILKLFKTLSTKKGEDLYTTVMSKEVRDYVRLLLGIAFNASDTLVKVVEFLFNDVQLKSINASEKGFIKQGEYFLEVYREQVLTNFVSHAELCLDHIIRKASVTNLLTVCRLIVEMCKFIFTKVQERSNGKILVDTFIASWPTLCQVFDVWKTSYKLADLHKIELISNIAMISPYQLWELMKKLPDLEMWILSLISKKDVSKEVKIHALELLPIITGPNDVVNEKLTAALHSFQAAHLPLISSEFKAESMERASLVVTFRTILEALVASQSPILLKFIIDATAGDRKHIMEYEIRIHLEKYVQHLAVNNQVECLQLAFDVFSNTQLEPNIRLVVSRRFLKTMVRACRTAALVTFYEKNIKKVVEMSDTSFGMTGRGWAVEQALVSRAGAYEMIESLFSMLPRDLLTPVSFALMGTPGTDIVKHLTKKAFKVRSEIFLTDDATAAELYRKYQCNAYSALCTIVSNTQKELKFYDGLLFKEEPSKSEFIWQRIINCKDENLYSNLEQEFPDYPKVRDLMVSIKRLARKNEGEYLKFSHTNNVFMSSLSQEVTKFDFTHAAIRSAEDVARREDDQVEFASVQLENDDINRHELMATLCALINHMFDEQITPIPADPSTRRTAPLWVEYIANAIESKQQHKNVRIFLCKLVDNCRSVFKYYCCVLMEPLMEFIVDECAGSTLNSFITDLVALILEWGEIYKPNDHTKTSASRLLGFLMRNCYHTRTEIFKLNLDLINRLIHQWRDFVQIPRQILYDLVNRNGSKDSKENICGLQLNAIVLSSGIIPWGDTIKINYIKALFVCLENDYKIIYQSAAHLLGMCLKHINPEGEIEDDQCSLELKQKIEMIKRSSEEKFIYILYGVQKNFPKILEPFMVIIGHLAPNTYGTKKKICLEMFLSGMETYGNTIFRELITLGIRDILKATENQLLGLHMINKAAKSMTSGEIAQLSDDLLAFVDHRNVECRDLMYEILINIVQIFKERDECETEVYRKFLAALLNGLSDADTDIQNRIFTFWSNERNLSQKLSERFLAILKELYDPKAEKHFLEYATQLLLDLPVHNANSKDQLFINQMENDHKLQEYEINVSWRSKSNHATMPLFVESQQRQVIVGSSLQMGQMLKATASEGFFQPTQEPTAITKIPETFSLSTGSSLLFSLPPQMLDRQSRHVHGVAESGALKPPQGNLRKRFIRDKEKVHKEHALKVIERKNFESQKRINTRRAKENEVVLFRRYRFGDFPDLLINGLALLLPLQALAKKDAIVARHMFISLYTGIITHNPDDAKTFQESVSSSISDILNVSKNCEAIVFATFMEVALSDPLLFNFSPDTVAISSIASNMIPCAALYIEWCLNILSTQAITNDDLKTNMWVKLAELYQNISENDMVWGIFADKLQTDSRLTRALDCEARGDLTTAQKVYISLLESDKQIEQNFCYESLYNCYTKMGKWSELATVGRNQLVTGDDDETNWEELWTDDWDHENLLPCLMKANMRLMLEEKSECQDFVEVLDGWLRVPEKANVLKMNFSEELIMFQVANEDYRSARVLSEQNFIYFLSEWGHLSILSDKLRSEKLFNLRRVAEIHRCIEILLSDGEKSGRVEGLIEQWRDSRVNSNDSLLMWDFLIAYRTFFGGLLRREYPNVNECITEMKLKLFNTAIQQRNLHLATCTLQSLQSLHVEEIEKSVKVQVAKCKLRNLKIETRNPTEAFDAYLQSSVDINKIITVDTFKEYTPELRLHIYNEMIDLLKKVSSCIPRVRIDDEQKEIIHNLTPKSNATDLSLRLEQQILPWLRKNVAVAEEISDSSSSLATSKILGDAYYRMATFCYNRLEERASVTLEYNFIICVFRGMRHDSKEARTLFPSLLDRMSLTENSDNAILFVQESIKVPEWMFISWIPQILARFNFAAPCILDRILVRLAKAYPAAIVYSFKLSYSQYVASQHQQLPNRKVVTEILNLIHNPATERFVSALSCLCLPKLMLSTHLTNFSNNLVTHGMTISDKMREINEILRIVFCENTENLQGSAFRQIEKFHQPIKELKNETSTTEIVNKVREMIKTLKNEIALEAHESIDMEKLCPWMAHCNAAENMNLELPGQYTGDVKPIVQHHTKIARFHSKLQVFPSLRKPMKLTVTGTDGKAHEYLVKYGEDLRQDQRIQQLLHLMSEHLHSDEQCRNHNLFIQTYQIIPVSQQCGLTTWVHGTAIMKNFIQRSLPQGQLDRILSGVLGEFKRYFSITEGQLYSDYGNMVTQNPRRRIRKKFMELQRKIPEDLVRKALWDISVSPECFFVLRNNFVKSLATMSIAHWILGIGDRHLGNLLLNTQNGFVVGIDFGVVFGGATINLSVPEMIPFRLTPKLVNVMSPFGESGLMKKCMIHALRSFNMCSKTIMACMAVFIQEPTVDWMAALRKEADNISPNEIPQWNSNRRIQIAEKKLQGWNPRALIEEELDMSVVAKEGAYLDGYKNILRGDEEMNIRAKLPDSNLSIDQQVSCLLDLATDPAILGASYLYFFPWI